MHIYEMICHYTIDGNSDLELAMQDPQFNVNKFVDTPEGRVPFIFLIAALGSFELFQLALAKNPVIDASAWDENILQAAINNVDERVLEYIVNPDNKIIEQFNDGFSPLHCAVIEGNLSKIRTILDENDSSILSQKDIRGKTALFYAGYYDKRLESKTIFKHPTTIKADPDLPKDFKNGGKHAYAELRRGGKIWFNFYFFLINPLYQEDHLREKSFLNLIESRLPNTNSFFRGRLEDEVRKENFNRAFIYVNKSLELFKRLENNQLLFEAYLNKAYIYHLYDKYKPLPKIVTEEDLEDPSNSGDTFKMAEDLKDESNAISLLQKIVTKENQEDPSISEDTFRIAKDLLEELTNEEPDAFNENQEDTFIIAKDRLEELEESSDEELDAFKAKYGFNKCINVKADGNCFLYAAQIQFLLHSEKETLSVKELRSKTIQHFRENKELYCDEDGLERFEKRLLEFSRPSEWADYDFIRAFSRCFNLLIVTLPSSFESMKPVIFKPKKPTHTFYFYFESVHFQALIVKDPSQLKLVPEMIEETPVDNWEDKLSQIRGEKQKKISGLADKEHVTFFSAQESPASSVKEDSINSSHEMTLT